MIKRIQYQLVKDRLSEKSGFVQVLVGPRQVGKTTMVHQILQEINEPYVYVSADTVADTDIHWIDQQWENARIKQRQNPDKGFILVFDELQKVNNWSNYIKHNYDMDTLKGIPIKVVILGSSRLLLQQGLTESMFGRYELIYMTHWTLSEMEEGFGFTPEQYAWYGGYPGAVRLIKASDETRWKDYILNSLVESSISRDVLMLTRVDKPTLLRRLFEVGCMYSSQILSLTKVMGELSDAGNTTTLSHYLELLDTSMLLAGLQKYSNNDIVRKKASIPKFQVYNTAFLGAFGKDPLKKTIQELVIWGRVVESVVGAHLINHALPTNYKVYYWRDGNDEVDFVLENRGNLVAIEVKSGASKRISGTGKFIQKMGAAKVYLVGKGGLPWEEFLKIHPSELF
jgi:predicted AAA+ superfamily ATPase